MLPVLGLVVATFAVTRSALLRTTALVALLAAFSFVFYGIAAPAVWQLFGWRWSGTLVGLALVLGIALGAPMLAERWHDRGWAARGLVYLPLAIAAIAIERNVTGTNPDLALALSPWPVVPIFGLEVGASFIACVLLGAGAAIAGWSRPGVVPKLLGLVTAVGLPVGSLWAGSSSGLLPFTAGPTSSAIGACAGLIAALAFGLPGRGDPDGLQRRGSRLALAGLLLGAPLLIGQAWNRLDYSVTRDGRAQTLIDGLARYYEREEMYPETLDELVTAGILDEVPRPRIGFGTGQQFVYQNMGADYLLEFSATRWIQCAYNPPWIDEEEEDLELADEEALGGAWSCPTTPPELW